MGLDMYFTARRWHRQHYLNEGMPALIEGAAAAYGGLPPGNHETCEFVVRLAYWRKANAIHGWFVKHVQDGEDNCQEAHVSVDDLRALVTLCKSLDQTRDSAKAAVELPPSTGFFFGSTGIDEWYWESVADTVEQLEPLLEWIDADPKRADQWIFAYRSSW